MACYGRYEPTASSGSGGDWIVKLPSARHPDVPEAEFAAMKLAAKIGIDVPEIDLLSLDQIDGIPEGITRYGESAFAIRRFDRGEEGPVHTEDFAQVFGVFADDKYENASYRQILSVLAIETDEQSVVEFVRRLTYSVLIGNGDMHLKNWSLVYPDRRAPILSPAYDLLSTVPYLGDEEAALKFRRSKAWGSYTYDELGAMADKARLATRPVMHQPDIIVAQHRDADHVQHRAYHVPTLGIDAQGSAGSRRPSCSSSIEILSGVRTNAMWPSRGGRLIATPASIRRRQVR